MNILKLLGIEHFDYKYHGESDMITPYYARWLARKNEDIEKYFREYNYNFDSINKLIDYFAVTTFSQYSLIPQNIIDLEKDISMQKLLSQQNKVVIFLKQTRANFDKSKLPKYLISNAEMFFKDDEEKIDINLIDAIINAACDFGKGTKVIFEKLIKSNYGQFIFRHFDKIKNIIAEDKSLLELFLKSYKAVHVGFNKLINVDFLTAVAVLSRNKKFDKMQIKPIVDCVVAYINDICQTNIVKDWLVNKMQLNHASIFLQSINYPNFAELQEKIKNYNKNEKEYFDKYRHKFRGEPFSLQPYVNFFENPGIRMSQKLFNLTHENGKHFANFNDENAQCSLVSALFTTTNPTTETFSMDYQQNISMFNNIFSQIAVLFFNKCKLIEIFDTLGSELAFVSQQYEFFDYTHEQIQQDIQLLADSFNLIITYINMPQDEDAELLRKPLYYGSCMLLFGLTEKLLNSIVKVGKKEMFLPKHLTLGELFQSNTEIPIYLKEILSEPIFNYIKYIIYYEEDITKKEKVGGNLRNIFAHYTDCYDQINYGTVMAAFLVYLSILNELAFKKVK